MRRSPVVGAAFGLLSFYWITIFLFDLLTGQIGLSGEWVARMGDRIIAIAIGGSAGVLLVGYVTWPKRHMARIGRVGDDVRGLTCSIGELPVTLKEPEQAKEVLQPMDLRLPKHKCIDRDWMRKWFAEYEESYPAHAAMLRACERFMNTNLRHHA
jgi:TM2 domain-containing membrane protein YozV